MRARAIALCLHAFKLQYVCSERIIISGAQALVLDAELRLLVLAWEVQGATADDGEVLGGIVGARERVQSFV